MHNGIQCEGEFCIALIKANCIDNNRKSGIKFSNSARGHIGGEGMNGSELTNLSDAEESGKEFGGPNDEYVRKVIDYYKLHA